MSSQIATPLIALACALGVFIILVVSLVLDHVCRNRRSKFKAEKTIYQPNRAPYSYQDNNDSWFVQAPPQSYIYEPPPNIENVDETVVPTDNYQLDEPQQLNMCDPQPDSPNIGKMLRNHLDQLEQDECSMNQESPLDYCYEGPDIHSANEGDLSGETNFDQNDSNSI